MGSTLWLLITYPSKLLPPETHFSLLYLRRSASTFQQLPRGASGGIGGKFLPVVQHAHARLFFCSSGIILQFHGRGGVVLQWNQ